MNCKQVREKMVDVLSNKLADSEKHRIQKHLNGCEKCHQEMETISAGDHHLKTFAEREVRNHTFLTSGRLENLEKQMDEGSKIINLYRLTSVAGAAAAVIIAIVFLPTWLGRAGPRSVESSQKTMKTENPSQDSEQMKTGNKPQIASETNFGAASEWQISSAGLKERSEEQVKGEEHKKEYTASAQELMGDRTPENPRAREQDVHKNHEENVFVPVEKSLYNSERDGYWW